MKVTSKKMNFQILATQILEVAIIENYLQKMGGEFEKFALKKWYCHTKRLGAIACGLKGQKVVVAILDKKA